MMRYTVTCFKDIACPWSCFICFCISFRVITVLRSLKVSFTCSMVLRRRVGLDSRLLASQQTKWDLQNMHENPEGKMKKTWLPYDIDIMPIVDTHSWYRRIIHESMKCIWRWVQRKTSNDDKRISLNHGSTDSMRANDPWIMHTTQG